MNTLFESFETSEDVTVLLAALHQAGLSWIAEEIEVHIQSGQLVTRALLSKKADDHIIVPFTADQQLKITLRTIQRYTLEMHKTWYWIQSDLRETLEDSNLQISLANLGSNEPLHLFNQEFESHLFKLDELLRRAWPDQKEPYDFIDHFGGGN